MSRLRYAAGLVLALTACSHSSLVLLPDEGGGNGEVAILQPDGQGGETVVNQANSRTALGSRRPVARPLGARGLRSAEAQLLDQLPPPAKNFALYFLEGTTEMTATSTPRVEEIRAEIAKRPGAEVEVTGHTDTVGGDADNDALSQKRAEEILGLLVSKGFDPTIMSAVGRGERELQVPTDDNVNSPVNRRVEVIVR